jgi:hypothetical protein
LAGPLILLATLGPADLARLDELRRRHYPADRNRVPAHLTIFRSLPPSAEHEVRRVLARVSAYRAPYAVEQGLTDLGSGVAIRIGSDDLGQLREELSADFHGLLSAQDGGGWIPHVTIQNKVEPKTARSLLRLLEGDFRPRPLQITGLELVRYSDGAWEALADYRFRGVS